METAYDIQLGLALTVTGSAARAAITDFAGGGPRGIDVGCGQGQHALWLAEAAGAGARVTGLDVSPAHLLAARRLAASDPRGDRVDFVEGDLASLPFPDRAFDWVWCADTLWPGVTTRDPVASVSELGRVLRPGGRLGLFYWSTQSLLPGHPLLEARLDAAFVARAPYLADVPPDHHYLRAGGWLSSAGFLDVHTRTYLAELRAPLSDPQREGLAFCFEMLWGDLESRVSRQDWDAFLRLCRPDSEESLLARGDYYGFVVYTLFTGARP